MQTVHVRQRNPGNIRKAAAAADRRRRSSVFTLLAFETVVRTPEYVFVSASHVKRSVLPGELVRIDPIVPGRILMLRHGAEFDVVVATRGVRQGPVRVLDHVGDLQHLGVYVIEGQRHRREVGVRGVGNPVAVNLDVGSVPSLTRALAVTAERQSVAEAELEVERDWTPERVGDRELCRLSVSQVRRVVTRRWTDELGHADRVRVHRVEGPERRGEGVGARRRVRIRRHTRPRPHLRRAVVRRYGDVEVGNRAARYAGRGEGRCLALRVLRLAAYEDCDREVGRGRGRALLHRGRLRDELERLARRSAGKRNGDGGDRGREE